MNMHLWLYLSFPRLQTDSMLATQHPLAVVHPQSHQVVQINDLASDVGLAVGMGLASAATLCSQLQVIVYDEKLEHRKLKEIAQWLYFMTADLVLDPPSGIWVRVSHMLNLYQGLDNYWHTLSEHLATLAVSYHASTGFSPLSAKLLAKAGHPIISDNQTDLLTKVKKHPLTFSELKATTIEKLQRIGIHTFDALLTLPLQELARRFDIELVNYIGKLTGQLKHPVDFYHPPSRFKQELELLFELDNVQWLEKPLEKLFRQLESYLTIRNKTAHELQLTLFQRNDLSEAISLNSAQGEYRSQQWRKLSALTLESTVLQAPVTRLQLEVIREGEPNAHPTDLFSHRTGQLSRLELYSLLQAKLGADSIATLSLNHDPRPEKATRYQSTLTEAPSEEIECQLLRPSFLLPAPAPLQHHVSLIHGPERIVSGWWDGDEIMRDYFIARTDQGQWLWVFRDQKKQWFLHGLFC
ncbi:DNA polymerase Y family protein [Vibrio vulnificus]|nr:DNA polymerase Y family protein [Vibrio vulnificus]